MPTHPCTRTSTMRRAFALLLPLALLLGVISADQKASADGSRHPYFNDSGTLRWYQSLRDAQRAAQREGKLIFVEYGRSRCSNCRKLAERILPDDSIRGRLQGIAIGLAADCDRPERAVYDLFQTYLPGARTLPFVAFLTPDGDWITGWAGGRKLSEVSQTLSLAQSTHTSLMRGTTGTTARRPTAVAPTPPAAPVPAARTANDCRGATRPADRDLEADEPVCEGDSCDVDPCAGGSCKPPTFLGLPNPLELLTRKCPPKPCPPCPPCTPVPAPAEPAVQPTASCPDFPPPAPRVEVPERRLADDGQGFGDPDGPASGGFPVPAPQPTLPAPAIRPTADAAPSTPAPNAAPPATPTTADARIRAARASADRNDWGSVLAQTRDAADEHPVLRSLNRQAHTWAHARLAFAVRAVREARYSDAQSAVDEVRFAMRGEAEGVDAERGFEAIEMMRDIEPLPEESLVRRTVRKTAYERMRGTRWAPLFSPVPQPTAAVATR